MENNRIVIVPIIATNGAGKTTIASTLSTLYNHTHHSVRAHLIELFKEFHGKEPENQLEIGTFADLLRKEKGPHAAIAKVVERIITNNTPGVYIIESLRCPGEVDFLIDICAEKNVQLKLIGIDAPEDSRYRRLVSRGDFKAPKSMEDFLNNERMEWAQEDPWKMSIKKCLEKVPAEGKFVNVDGTLYETVGKIQDYLLRA